MLYPIIQPDGTTLITLICDYCRQPISQSEYPSATVDFTPFSIERLQSMPADQIPSVRHFHGECAPEHCTGSHWQKADHVLLAMVGGLFDEPGDVIGAAVNARRLEIGPGFSFP